ncbi:MAG: S-layer homology domain-containing protein, partial [Clostridia bacterium]|nr:S-layer homology domain-containing protein [Clostridia bacterium]
SQEMTREQLATMFYRYAEKNSVNVDAKANLTEFIDASSVGSWATDACAWAIGAGLLGSTDSSKKVLSPQMTVTRAQAAKIFMSYDNIK